MAAGSVAGCEPRRATSVRGSPINCDMDDVLLIGWREWLALPALGLAAIKAKIDTGALSSSLHVARLETFERDGRTWLCFALAPRRRGGRLVICEAPATDCREVTDSGGRTTQRWFVHTDIVL